MLSVVMGGNFQIGPNAPNTFAARVKVQDDIKSYQCT
jgi:hypothetical protein